MRRLSWITAAATGAVLSACGNGATSGTPAAAPDGPPYEVADGEVLVSCGGDRPGWRPSLMAEGLPGVLTNEQARDIFAGILEDPMMGEEAALSLLPDGVDVDWRVLVDDGDALTLGLGLWTEDGPSARGGVPVLHLARESGDWRATSWGDCRLSPVLTEANSWVEVRGYDGDATSTRLTAEVGERECTSGRDPGPFLHEPIVVETDETVTLFWTADPARGGQDCQGNPTVEQPVDLAGPLGTRTLLDGSTYPPAPVPRDQR